MSGQDKERVQLQKAFSHEILKHTADLNAAFDAHNWEAYRITVHGMKSALRIVGANELGEFAYKLELAAKNGEHDTCVEQTGDFTAQVLRLADAFKKELDELAASSDSEKESADIDSVREVLGRLLQACKQFNLTAADEILDELRDRTVNDPSFDKKLFDIVERVDMVEYSDAAGLIEELLKTSPPTPSP